MQIARSVVHEPAGLASVPSSQRPPGSSSEGWPWKPPLQPAPDAGRGVWPAGGKRWTNAAAEGDLATAACPRLAEAFGDRVEDHLVFNGRHAHNAEPYLNSVPTGAALADALGLSRRS